VGWRGVLCWQMPVNQTRNGQARMPCKESTHNRPAGRGHTWRVNNNAWSAKNDTLARTPTTVGKPIVVTVSKTRTCNKTDGACEQSCPTVVGKPITVDQSKSQSCNTHASGTHTPTMLAVHRLGEFFHTVQACTCSHLHHSWCQMRPKSARAACASASRGSSLPTP